MASFNRGWVLAVLLGGCTPGGSSDDGPATEGSSGGADSSTMVPTATGGATMPSEDSGGSTSSTSETGPDPDTGSSDDGSGCELPMVDEKVLNQLFIDGGGAFVEQGGSLSLRLTWIDFGFPTEVEACVEWSIDPVDGVSIDAEGVLTVDAAVPLDTVISVTADVEEGRRILDANFTVYEPLDSPILGFWSEIQQLPCDGGDPFMPEPIIPELIFYDTGEFTVTWTPFEVYIDYWGTFTHDVGTGALSLNVTGGNYVPDDVDPEGTATVTDGVLTLEELWLGTAQEPVTPAACGHVFE